MPLVYRRREGHGDRPVWAAAGVSERLWIESDGVYAWIMRDGRGTWRGRICLTVGRHVRGAKLPPHRNGVAVSLPSRVTEGEAVLVVEREIRATVRVLGGSRGIWWRAIPPNIPQPLAPQILSAE